MRIERKESTIEKAFVAACRRYGGDAVKLTSPGRNGMPDRLIFWPGGLTTYAELKRPGEQLRDDQETEIDKLLKAGHLAMVVRTELDMALFIKLSLERMVRP